MPTLLSLPPELVIKIFTHLLVRPTETVDPLQVLPLTLIHPSLTPIAHQYLFIDLKLFSDHQVRLLVESEAFKRYAATTRRVIFDPSNGSGIGTGGIGSETTISGELVEKLLQAIERSFEESEVDGKLEELDIVGCSVTSSLSLCGKSLANLKRLSIGSAVTSQEGPSFKFHLDSLTFVNNHWQSLSNPLIEQLCKQTCQAQENFTGLKILDVSGLYSVQSFFPLLDDTPQVFPSVQELYLPPFETLDQVLFSTLLLEQVTSESPLAYLELPNLPDSRTNLHFIPFLETMSTKVSSMLEIGFKNHPGQALLDALLIVLQILYGGPPGSPKAEASGCKLERVRMLKLNGTAEVSRTMEREGELVVDLIGQFGCEVEYGEYRRARE